MSAGSVATMARSVATYIVSKRKLASRPTSLFLVNPSLFSASRIELIGSHRLWRRSFGASQGQLWGQLALLTNDATQGRYRRCDGPELRGLLRRSRAKALEVWAHIEVTATVRWREPVKTSTAVCL